MKEFELKYGCNPNQKPARIYMDDGELPVRVLNGRPGYINFLDALNGWQLVSEIKRATGYAAATSFKHVSPTSAAIGKPLSETLKRACFVEDVAGLDASPIACAYARARGTDRMSSFGDWIALSDECDEVAANVIKREVSDGIIAPSYTPQALEILKQKRKGNYNVVQIDPDYRPAPVERKTVFGVTFEQGRNDLSLSEALLTNVVTKNTLLPEGKKLDMVVALITLKYTQSNSVCFAFDGQAIGVGAGQQSRIHCTRLAAAKADNWFLRQNEKVLSLPFRSELSRPDMNNVIDLYLSEEESEFLLADGTWQNYFTRRPDPLSKEEKREILGAVRGVTVASDAFFPFSDNLERAHRSGVDYVVQPGGSVRDDDVIATADKYGMVMVFDGVRLFHH